MKSAEELRRMNNTSITSADMEGWAKIAQDGGIFITGTFWNSQLKETVSLVLRDYEYNDLSRDNDYLYFMQVDSEAIRDYKKFKGIIQDGDKVKVIKGRTLPKDFVGTVKEVYPVKDRYGRFVANYIRFTTGEKINVANVELIRE